MCTGRDTCLFLVDPLPGADRVARAHLRPWLIEHAFDDDDAHDVLVAVSDALAEAIADERDRGGADMIQVGSAVEDVGDGTTGLSVRIVDRTTMPLSRGGLSAGRSLALAGGLMEQVSVHSEAHAGRVIMLRTRPLGRRSDRAG